MTSHRYPKSCRIVMRKENINKSLEVMRVMRAKENSVVVILLPCE